MVLGEFESVSAMRWGRSTTPGCPRAQIVWLGVPGCLYTCLITNMGDEEVAINQAARSLRNLVGIPLMHEEEQVTVADRRRVAE